MHNKKLTERNVLAFTLPFLVCEQACFVYHDPDTNAISTSYKIQPVAAIGSRRSGIVFCYLYLDSPHIKTTLTL